MFIFLINVAYQYTSDSLFHALACIAMWILILYGYLEMDHDDMLLIRSQSTTRGHSRKLFPKNYRINVRKHFFSVNLL